MCSISVLCPNQTGPSLWNAHSPSVSSIFLSGSLSSSLLLLKPVSSHGSTSEWFTVLEVLYRCLNTIQYLTIYIYLYIYIYIYIYIAINYFIETRYHSIDLFVTKPNADN